MKLLILTIIPIIFNFVSSLSATEDSLTVDNYLKTAIEARQNNEIGQSILLLKKGLKKCKNEKDYKSIYNALGTSYFKKRDYHTALAYYDSAFTFLDINKDSLLLAYLYNNYGTVHMQLEEYNKALVYYKLASDNIGANAKGALLYNMGKCAHFLGNKKQASIYFTKSYEHNLKQFGKVNYNTAISGIALIQNGDSSKTIDLREPIEKLNNKYVSSLFYYYTGDYEKAKEYANNNNDLKIGIYTKTKHWYRAVALIDSLRKSFISVDSKFFLQSNEMLIYKNAIDDTIQSDMKQAFHYAQKSYGNILKEVSGYKLSDTKDSYNYFDFDSVIYLFIINNKQFEFHKITADSVFWEQYLTYMHTYNPQYKDEYYKNYINFINSGYYLYKRLIPKKDEEMHIVSSGRLQYLPFECLPTQIPSDTSLPDFKAIPYLIKESTIHYDYVLRDYKKPKGRKTITALAPDASLEYAVEEVKALKLFKSNRFLGKESLKSEINNGDILHIATHYNPKRFSIQFSDSTLDLNNLKKKHRDMVVLSTCLSGEGQFQVGEGIISPARKFYASDAECVIESSWNAADMSAYLIVWNFYKQLKLGKNKATALRNAKLKFLKETPHHYSHPFLWGNFRLFGNNYPIKMGFTPIISIQLKIFGALLIIITFKNLLSRNRKIPF